MAKTAWITLNGLKEPDRFGELADDLKLPAKTRRRFFEFGEYASIEIQVDENLKIVGGSFLPLSRR